MTAADLTPVSPIRVLCVDDHHLVREGLCLIVNREPDMTVVASAPNGEQAVELFREHRPDVTLMDVRLPKMSGVAAIHAIRREAPEARIIVLTMYQGEEDIHRALEAGAATYLLKHALSQELVSVIRQVHDGKRPVPANVAAALIARTGQRGISSREADVLRLVSSGLRNREVGQVLGITEETVRAHLRRIFEKLEVNDRTAAVNVAVKRGIIHRDGD